MDSEVDESSLEDLITDLWSIGWTNQDIANFLYQYPNGEGRTALIACFLKIAIDDPNIEDFKALLGL